MIVKHVAVATIIRNRKFLAVRNVGRTVWTLPGGHVEGSETAEQCVIREVREELDFSPDEVTFLADYDNLTSIEVNTLVKLHIFIMHCDRDLRSIDPEIEEVMWIDSKYAGEKGELINSQKDFTTPKLLGIGLID